MLGGRLFVSAPAAAPAPRRAPLATAVPPCRKRRRVVGADLSSTSIGLLIADPRLKLDPHETLGELHLQFAAVSKAVDFDHD
jgi:hypothetical protein